MIFINVLCFTCLVSFVLSFFIVAGPGRRCLPSLAMGTMAHHSINKWEFVDNNYLVRPAMHEYVDSGLR